MFYFVSVAVMSILAKTTQLKQSKQSTQQVIVHLVAKSRRQERKPVTAYPQPGAERGAYARPLPRLLT